VSPSGNERTNVEDLLREGVWVRALARRLVTDDAAADDIVQDTWVAAMRSAPVERERLRPWLARVVRNFATATRRTDANRAARESQAARREPARSELETAERLEAQRALVDALEALAEPYRTTLMRRYFDGLSSADIALADCIPAATVRWRVAHGVDELRKRLDRRYGDRASWALAFLPLTRTPAPVAMTAAGVGGVTTFGILAMSTATRATIAAIVLLTASVGIWVLVEEREPLAPPPAASSDGGAALAATPSESETVATELASAVDEGVRTEVELETPAAPLRVAATSANSVRVDGRFVDASDRGIGKVRIVQPQLAGAVESDEQGHFVLSVDAGRSASSHPFESRADGWATHFSDVLIQRGTDVHLGPIVLAPGGTIAGTVVDENDNPVEGAWVLTTKPALNDEVSNLQRTGPSITTLNDAPSGVPWTTSGADGSFRLEGVPAELVRAWSTSTGMRWTLSEPLQVPARGGLRDVALKLVRLAIDDRIEGIVLDPSGAPVPLASIDMRCMAWEWSGNKFIRSGPDGRFRYAVPRKSPYDLRCTAPRLDWPAISMSDIQPGTLDLVLQFREPLTLELLVQDEKGEPIDSYEYMVWADRNGQGGKRELHENGRTRLKMPTIPFTVEVSARGRTAVMLGPIDPATATETLVATLEHLPGLRGRVMDGETPVAGAKLSLLELVSSENRMECAGFPSRLQGTLVDREVTDAEGRFLVNVRKAGTFALLCEAKGYAIGELSPLEFDPRVGLDGLELQVSLGGVIEGRVLTPEGRDAAGVVVGISRFDCRPLTQRVGADGRFRFENLTSGGWIVRRSAQEVVPNSSSSTFGPASSPVSFEPDCTVASGLVTEFDLDLRNALDVTFVGHVTQNGVPATGWTVALTPEDVAAYPGDPPSGVVDARGNVRVTLPRPASYRLDLMPVSETGAPVRAFRSLAIRGGDNVFETILECGTLEGVVSEWRDGLRLDCSAVGESEWGFQGTIACDENGRFRVPHVPTGQARLTLWDTRAEDGWKPLASKQLEIRRDATASAELP